MVFLSVFNYARIKGPDQFWKQRKVFKLTANYYGRRRNCYSIAIKSLHKALQHMTAGRKQKKLDRKEHRVHGLTFLPDYSIGQILHPISHRVQLWIARISAACEELGTSYHVVMENLARSNIGLNNKTVADLAIWEPRTFKSLVQLALAKDHQQNPRGLNSLEKPPEGVITRGML